MSLSCCVNAAVSISTGIWKTDEGPAGEVEKVMRWERTWSLSELTEIIMAGVA